MDKKKPPANNTRPYTIDRLPELNVTHDISGVMQLNYTVTAEEHHVGRVDEPIPTPAVNVYGNLFYFVVDLLIHLPLNTNMILAYTNIKYQSKK